MNGIDWNLTSCFHFWFILSFSNRSNNEYVQKEKVPNLLSIRLPGRECAFYDEAYVLNFFIFWYFCGLLVYTSQIYYGITQKWFAFAAFGLDRANVSVKLKEILYEKPNVPKTISSSCIRNLSIECMFCEWWTLPMMIIMMINYPRPAELTGSIVLMCPRNIMWKMKRKIHPWLFNAFYYGISSISSVSHWDIHFCIAVWVCCC